MIDGRYAVLELIDAGGSGQVWEAVDQQVDQRVALKTIRVVSTAHRARVRREIAALKMLQIPGVVKLLDVGEALGEPYIVMERVHGSRFPGLGNAGHWRLVVAAAAELCEIVARVHAVGIVHRDLKPGNVLVEPGGRVVLLDFGLARGRELAQTVTEHGGVVGTPKYMAPEQFAGRRVDGRADLYALGVMIYEAINGVVPQADTNLVQRWLRPGPAAAPAALEGAPPELDQLVRELLADNPDSRPSSAVEVATRLAALLGRERAPGPVLPFAGREALLAEALASLGARESIDLWGPPGSGRSRLLAELAVALRAAGTPAVVLSPGKRPLESLAPLRPTPAPGERAMDAARAAVTRALSSGTVLLVDTPETVDLWSAKIVDLCRDNGPVVRAIDSPGALRLGPIPESAMRDWFHGPDIFLHLREDAAALLARRTRGHARAVEQELTAWVATGRAAWDEGKLRVSRAALEELAAGFAALPPGAAPQADPGLPEPLAELLGWIVHAGAVDVPTLTAATGLDEWEVRMEIDELDRRGCLRRAADSLFDARAVPHSAELWPEERIVQVHRQLARARAGHPALQAHHHLEAGDLDAACDAALEAAEVDAREGRFGRARAHLSIVLRAARAAERVDIVSRLIPPVVAHALYEGTPAALRDARWLSEHGPAEVIAPVNLLLDGWAAADEGRWPEAWAAAQHCGPFAHEGIESQRLALAVRCAIAGRQAEPDVLLAEIEPRARASSLRARWLSWRGLWLYEQGDFAGAALLQEEAMAADDARARRMLSAHNRAIALLELFEYDTAGAVADELATLAREARRPATERDAAVIDSVIRYRRGLPNPAEVDLLEASRVLGTGNAHHNLCLTAAARAWREHRLPDAVALAREAAREPNLAGRPQRGLLPRAIILASGEGDAAAARETVDDVMRLLPVRQRMQALALVASCHPGAVGTFLLRLVADAATVPIEHHGKRLEVLATTECLSYARAASGGAP